MFDWLLEPLQFEFMQNALLTAFIVSIICALLSCYLVLKGWSLMGDAISHAVLPGIVLAYLAGIPLAIGAFFSGIFCSLGVGYLKENSRIKEDTAMGIVFSGMFAIGLVMFTKIQTEQHLTHILFGNVLGVSHQELIQSAVISAVIFCMIVFKRKDFLLTLTKSFDKMLWIAIVSSITSSLIGVILSYHFDASTGACIILLQAIFFIGALFLSRIKQKTY